MDQEKRQQLHDLLTRIPREYTYHIIKYAAEEEGVTPLEITLQDASKVIENKGIDFAISQIIFSIAYGLADRLIFDLLGMPESEIIIRLETIAQGQNNENDKNISMIYEDQGRSQKEKDDVFKALINTYLRRGLKLVTADIGGKLRADLQREEQRLASSASWAALINNTFKSIILNTLFKEIDDLKTYLETEVKNPEYHGMSVDGLIDGYLDGNAEVKDLFIKALRAARQADNIVGLFPKIQSTGTPKHYTSPNTTLSNALQAIDGKGEVIGAGALRIPVTKDKETEIYVDATLENMEGVTLTGKPFTEYDRAVHDAVVSLVLDREKNQLPAAATAEMIYRIMTHKTDTEKASPQQKGAITKSIEKMRKNIYVYADATEEMKKKKIVTNPDGKTDDEKYRLVLDNFLLSGTHFDNLGISGANVSGWIFEPPMLLNYAKLTGQLFTVNGQLLSIHKVDKNGNISPSIILDNENRISVKSYLLRRVQVMKNDEDKARDAYRKYQSRRKTASELPEKYVKDFRKKQRTILFDSLFDAVGITHPNSKTKTREYVFNVLDYWKARPHDGISDYKKRKKGKTYDAVIIEI